VYLLQFAKSILENSRLQCVPRRETIGRCQISTSCIADHKTDEEFYYCVDARFIRQEFDGFVSR